MLEEEENSTGNLHDAVKRRSTHLKVGIGSSSRAAVKVYATTAEAIANFKPTHREVISGIAPHVFDERKRRRSQRRASSSSRTSWCEPSAEKRPSPLRGTTVSAFPEEHSIHLGEHYLYCFRYPTNSVLDQADPSHRSKEKENIIERNSIDTFPSTNTVNVQKTPLNHSMEKIHTDNLKTTTEPRWKCLRFDTHLYKLR